MINHLCVLSEVAPSYAPAGRSLVAVCLRGDRADAGAEQALRDKLAGWFGRSVFDWQHLRTDRIPAALPPLPVIKRPGPSDRCELSPGLFACGDYRDGGTLDGAIRSGRATAEVVAHRLIMRRSAPLVARTGDRRGGPVA